MQLKKYYGTIIKNKNNCLTNLIITCIIKIENGDPQTWFTKLICKKTHRTGQVTDVFFIVYLLKIITSITKANTIIVSTTKPNKSRYIISNKITSIIAPPPHS